MKRNEFVTQAGGWGLNNPRLADSPMRARRELRRAEALDYPERRLGWSDVVGLFERCGRVYEPKRINAPALWSYSLSIGRSKAPEDPVQSRTLPRASTIWRLRCRTQLTRSAYNGSAERAENKKRAAGCPAALVSFDRWVVCLTAGSRGSEPACQHRCSRCRRR